MLPSIRKFAWAVSRRSEVKLSSGLAQQLGEQSEQMDFAEFLAGDRQLAVAMKTERFSEPAGSGQPAVEVAA